MWVEYGDNVFQHFVNTQYEYIHRISLAFERMLHDRVYKIILMNEVIVGFFWYWID